MLGFAVDVDLSTISRQPQTALRSRARERRFRKRRTRSGMDALMRVLTKSPGAFTSEARHRSAAVRASTWATALAPLTRFIFATGPHPSISRYASSPPAIQRAWTRNWWVFWKISCGICFDRCLEGRGAGEGPIPTGVPLWTTKYCRRRRRA